MHGLKDKNSQLQLIVYKILMPLALLASVCLAAGMSLAADNQPIQRVVDDSKVMSRVQLVGVIADGSGKNKGIAVIKDTETGRSYAIKTGDSLPGVSHIILTDVQRDGLEFKTTDQRYVVRPFINTDSADQTTDLAAQNNTNSDQSGTQQAGPGLFEKWAAGTPEGEVDSISSEVIKTLQKKFESLDKEESTKDRMRANNAPTQGEGVSSDSEDGIIYEEDVPEDF